MGNIQNKASKAIIEQVTNNTTSWIGHRSDNKEVLCGQTFVSPSEGELDSIQVFSSIVTTPGSVKMTLHNFDPARKSWGPAIGSASIDIKNSYTGQWISFYIPGMRLIKGNAYGFRLESTNAYMGVGEAAGSSSQPPFNDGQEWQFINNDPQGHSFSYFSLAFKVGLRA